MTTTFRVQCDCGFRRLASVGGTRENYLVESYFPFYCETCGLVDVNVRAKEIFCPDCNSKNVKQYGKPPISLEGENSSAVRDFEYSAPHKGNLCPACKKMTLEFGRPIMLSS